MTKKTLYTIGHSNHALEVFLALLKAHEINQIIDVRTIPKSRLFPWFNQEALSRTLHQCDIIYVHLKELGGLRKTSKTSINTAWKNLSFRGFADYMQTQDFINGLHKLNILLDAVPRTAIMCAEAVPWRCHRSLIADAEIANGIIVYDILNTRPAKEHKITSFAKLNKNTIPISVYYPPSS